MDTHLKWNAALVLDTSNEKLFNITYDGARSRHKDEEELERLMEDGWRIGEIAAAGEESVFVTLRKPYFGRVNS